MRVEIFAFRSTMFKMESFLIEATLQRVLSYKQMVLAY